MSVTKQGKLIKQRGWKIRQHVRAWVRRIPHPRHWPGWLHFLHEVAFFAAGFGMALLWLHSWPLCLFVALIIVGLFVFLR